MITLTRPKINTIFCKNLLFIIIFFPLLPSFTPFLLFHIPERECDKKTSGEGVAALGGRGLGPRHRRVTALKVFTGGFLCACGPDKVFVFQKSDDVNEHYFQVA